MGGVRNKVTRRLKAGLTRDAGGDVVVQMAVGTIEEAEIFTKVNDVRGEGGKNDQQDNTKEGFPFMEQRGHRREWFS